MHQIYWMRQRIDFMVLLDQISLLYIWVPIFICSILHVREAVHFGCSLVALPFLDFTQIDSRPQSMNYKCIFLFLYIRRACYIVQDESTRVISACAFTNCSHISDVPESLYSCSFSTNACMNQFVVSALNHNCRVQDRCRVPRSWVDRPWIGDREREWIDWIRFWIAIPFAPFLFLY
jgi:hypothetical protein